MSSPAASSASSEPEPVELPKELLTLADFVDAKPESLVLGDAEIQSAALEATKFLFDRAVLSEHNAAPVIDDLLKSVQAPQRPVTRSTSVKQRSTTQAVIPPPHFELTQLQSLVLDGMGADQVWEQLELRTKSVCSVLESIIERQTSDAEDDDTENPAGPSDGVTENGFDDMDVDDESEDDMALDEDDDDESEEEDEEESGEDVEEYGEDTTVKLRDEDSSPGLPLWKGPRHPLLDDGFFSIDKFNRDTELLEAKSKSGGRLGRKSDDSDDSDEELEEEIDLFAPVENEDSEDEVEDASSDDEAQDDDDDGLAHAEDDDSDDEDDEDYANVSDQRITGALKTEGIENIMFSDFFRKPFRFEDVPPNQPSSSSSRKGKGKVKAAVRFSEEVRVRKIKARGKSKKLDEPEDPRITNFFANPFMGTGAGGFGGFAPRQPVVASQSPQATTSKPTEVAVDEDESDEDEDADVGLSFEGMDDLGESDEDDGDEEEADSEEDEAGEAEHERETMERVKDDILAEPDAEQQHPPDLSTHEKRLRAIAQEIAILEDENVADKPWELMGEANAKRRPENSLLETDLDFEQAAKPTPLITEEVTKSLEDLIKSRILENRFDDVVRQRPIDDKAFLPADVIELQDSQSKKSLAQIYEEDYQEAAAGESSKGGASQKLLAEHEELDNVWNDISYKLDGLSNAHFTPKAPKSSITTISNVASTTLESALPTSMATASLFAPEEVFAHDQRATKAKSEMTSADKRHLRAKIKHERKKRSQVIGNAVVKFANGTRSSASGAAGLNKQPKTVREAKDAALESLVKTGKGVTVVGKLQKGKERDKQRPLNGAAQIKL